MFRAKTAKRSSSKKNQTNVSGPITPVGMNDISGGAIAKNIIVTTTVATASASVGHVSTESMLNTLLDAESSSAVLRPWLRLERGTRMRLLRSFVDAKHDLTSQERSDLLSVLVDSLDKKNLNSKSQITYNATTGHIVEINALRINKNTAGKHIFRIDPPYRSTKKIKRTAGSDSDS
jgi:hypothetical protein